jgi:hypothetical protein
LCTVATRAQGVGEERPGVDVAQAAGIDDAGDDAEGARARFGSGAVGNPTVDHPVAQDPFGQIVGCALQGTVDPSVEIRPG